MLPRLLVPAVLLTLTWGQMGRSNYCRDSQGYFYHCDDSSWGSGNSWRQWYGQGGFSDLSRSLGRGQVTFAPSGGVQLTCDFSQTGRSDFGGDVTDIVWRKVDRSFRGSMGSRSYYNDNRYSTNSGFSNRASYVNIGSVDADFRDRYEGRYSGNSGGRFSGAGSGYYSGGYNNIGSGNYGNSNGGYYGNGGGGFYGGRGSSGMGSFSGGYVRDDYRGSSGSGFSSRPGYSGGFYGSGFGSSSGFGSGFGSGSGCGAGSAGGGGCGGGGGGGGGCGGRPWYRCMDTRARRRRRQAGGPASGLPVSCWVTQGVGWSTLTLTRPGPAEEGLYICVGRTGGSRAVSMEVELSRYVEGGRYRSAALMKTQPDRVVEEAEEGGAEGESTAVAAIEEV